MVINGKERKFLLTVNAAEKIAAYCPDNDFNKFVDMTKGKTFTENVKTDIAVAVILANEYEESKALDSPSYKPDLISEDDFDTRRILPKWIRQLESEIADAIIRDAYGKIETEEVKKTDGAKAKREKKSGST